MVMNISAGESADKLTRLMVGLAWSEVPVRDCPVVGANIHSIHRERSGKTVLFDPCLRDRQLQTLRELQPDKTS